MFIAFEGPDNTGKSTSAATLSHNGVANYNATKDGHALNQELEQQQGTELPITYDRIDWFSHMVYRLALPEHEWNDERPRTVFAMPDTHLVVKLHHPQLAPLIDDELYETGKLAQVNPLYFEFASWLMAVNEMRDYALFRTISLIEVRNDPRTGAFSQSLAAFSSPAFPYGTANQPLVHSDVDLLELLRYDESQRVA